MMAKLNNGVNMPMLGLGTWQSGPSVAEEAVLWALQSGYRHIDTAAIYGNEREVGVAIKKSGIPRKELFIVTKLWIDGFGNPKAAFEQSLKKLGLDYVDLYLLHYPVEGKRLDAWKVLEQLYAEKKCRAIGVSNFTVRHLQELLKVAKIVPAVNQVEFTPYLYQKELLDYCRKNNIQLEAYSPLTRGQKLGDAKLVAIAKKYGKTSAQILIRWCLQHGVVAIPKSRTKKRIIENFEMGFELSAEDMKRMDGFNEDLRYCWDPTGTP